MFKCQQCSNSGLRPTFVVVERKMVNHLKAGELRGPRGGRGSQIVRELRLCEACATGAAEAPLERADPVPVTRTKEDFNNGMSHEEA